MSQLQWEDFTPGRVFEHGPRRLPRDEMIAFAAEFDPQPMHLDDEAARATMLGGLAASGWHSCAIMMRMMCDWFVLDSASWGGPGVEEVKWLKPVRPGDNLTLRRTVAETRHSNSRPQIGFVKFQYELLNQARETAVTLTCTMMIGRRAVAEFAAAGASGAQA